MRKLTSIIAAVSLLTSCMMGKTEESTMTVPKIDIDINDPAALDKTFASLESNPIDCCNWKEAYPYAPSASFKIFHTGGHMVIRFYVEEKYTGAIATVNNGRVWEDSCVEFFISPGRNMQYYNFETNCIGTMLVAHRDMPGTDPWESSDEVQASIIRIPSLGRAAIDPQIEGDNKWTMTLIVPATALYADHFDSWSGLDCNMNFYKCGDHMKEAHFLSWAPIEWEKPAFHKPEFFREVIFE